MIIYADQATGTVDVWLAERIIINKQARDESSTLQVVLDTSSETIELATYHAAKIGENMYEFAVDVTDVCRAYKNSGLLTFTLTPDDESEVVVEVQAVGLVNPANVLIPEDERGVLFATIQPPSVIIRDDDLFGISQLAEIRSNLGYWRTYTNGEWSSGESVAGLTSVGIASGCEQAELYRMLPRPERATCVLREPMCGKRYAIVEWESFTGVTRRHIMEACKQSGSVSDAYSLLHIDNGYKTIKGHADGFSLRMEGLSRYDVWYYSDIVLSSRVRVTFDGTNWYIVAVDADDYTLNDGDGGEFSTIEIPIKFRKYDAVSMQ